MTNIDKISEYTVTGTFDIDASIKADETSTEKKQVTLKVICKDTPLKDVISRALSSVRISWQNGPGRSKFDTWTNRQSVIVDFASPGAKAKVDPKQAMIDLLKSMATDEEREAYIQKELLGK